MNALIIRPPAYSKPQAHPQDNTPPMEAAIVKGILKKKHTVQLLDLESHPNSKQIFNFIRKRLLEKPKIIFIKVTTLNLDISKDIISLIKKKSLYQPKIYCYGQHATTRPKELEKLSDGCIIGEPEDAMVELIKTGKLSKTKHYESAAFLTNVAPDHSVFEKEYFSLYPTTKLLPKWGFVQTSRGCPFNCKFCSPTLRESYGSKIRLKSISSIKKELSQLKATGKNSIYIIDDCFGTDTKNLKQISKELKKLDFSWACQMRADQITEEKIKNMKQNGCSSVCVGVESGSQKILKELNKGITVEQIKSAFKILNKYKIKTVAFFMLGSPTESLKDINKTITLYKEIKPTIIQVAFYTKYPSLKKENLKRISMENLNYNITPSHYKNPGEYSKVNKSKLIDIQSRFYRMHYFSFHFIKYYLRFKLLSLLNPTQLSITFQSITYLIRGQKQIPKYNKN